MSKPVLAALTDTHLKESNIDTNKSVYQQLVEFCVENNIKRAFHFGDIFDSRKAMPLKIGETFIEILDEYFLPNNIELVAIAGNHDKTNYDSESSFLDLFRFHPNFKVVKVYERLEVSEDFIIHLVPFFKETSGVYSDIIKGIKVDESCCNILGTHVAIDGVMNNDGSTVEGHLSLKEFKKFDLVTVGHYHNEQFIGDNIWYCGSSFQHNYGEDDNKGMIIFHSDGTWDKKSLNTPKYVKEKVNIEDLEDFILNTDFLDKAEGNFSRIELFGESEKLKSFDISILEKKYGISVLLKPSEAIISLSDTESITHDKNSLIVGFKEFCKENKVKDVEYGLQKLWAI